MAIAPLAVLLRVAVAKARVAYVNRAAEEGWAT